MLCSGVSVFAGHRIHFFIFAKCPDAGCEKDQFTAVRDHHAGAVHAFIADPCGFQFCRLQVCDNLRGPSFHMDDVELLCQFAGMLKRLSGLPDV